MKWLVTNCSVQFIFFQKYTYFIKLTILLPFIFNEIPYMITSTIRKKISQAKLLMNVSSI
ncbi:MAG TPA: hypothetical protein DCP51_02510 [Clostridiales bacterium]|nr:hypothetical protein [Clostridiales bacterium]